MFPLVAATMWASAVGVFSTIGRLAGPEDERGSWGEVIGAIVGNFAVVFVLCLTISLVLWARERRTRR